VESGAGLMKLQDCRIPGLQERTSSLRATLQSLSAILQSLAAILQFCNSAI
jgi:hypothetical protein